MREEAVMRDNPFLMLRLREKQRQATAGDAVRPWGMQAGLIPLVSIEASKLLCWQRSCENMELIPPGTFASNGGRELFTAP